MPKLECVITGNRLAAFAGLSRRGCHIPEEVTERRLIETQDSHETVLVHEIENFRLGPGRGNSRNDARY